MIKASICVSDIDKARLKKANNGKFYLNFIIMESRNDKYGNDYMIKEDTTKEERDNGYQAKILGNGKNVGGSQSSSSNSRPSRSSDDLPF